MFVDGMARCWRWRCGYDVRKKQLWSWIIDPYTCSGVFYFFGGMLQIIGSVMEWILGNTFPFVVFGTYGKSSLAQDT